LPNNHNFDRRRFVWCCKLWLVRGSLGIFSLLDLLQLLGSNQSKGYLSVHHPNEREGQVFFEAGKVVYARFGTLEDVAAVRALLLDERGNFEFVPGRTPIKKTINSSLDNFLFEVIRELDGGTKTTEQLIPPPNELDSPRITDQKRIGSLTLSGEEFSVIELIDGERSVIGIAQLSKQPLELVQRVLVRFASLGLVEVKKRQPRIARLVIGLSRELTDMRVCLDEVILKTWSRQHRGPVSKIRMRDEAGQEYVFDVFSTPNLGAYILFSSNAIMRYDFQAGAQVLVKPEP
jgi:hypothetical protein